MLLLLFSCQHICSLSLTYMSNIIYQMLDIRHLNNHYSKKKMCFIKVKMKEWHFRLPSFWQSYSPRNVFFLILVDFPQLLIPLHCHHNLRSYYYLIEFPTLFLMCSIPSLPSWSSCLCSNMSSDSYLPRKPRSYLNSYWYELNIACL